MATVPIAPSPPVPSDHVERQFRRLEGERKVETEHHSSSTRIMDHPALRQIVAIGHVVVPLMLGDLGWRDPKKRGLAGRATTTEEVINSEPSR